MNRITLDGEWTVEALSGPPQSEQFIDPITAIVPGCVHTDLLRAGRIDDPFDGANEAEYQWIGSTVWRYTRTFEWSPDDADRQDLVADGLDTLATVMLNGMVVGTTANQHRSYRFPIGHLLREGRNELVVTFDAPVPSAERLADAHGGALPHENRHPYNSLRKNASNFGWDWGIDVATSGIWRSIAVESWSGVRIGAVRPLVDVVDREGILTVHVDLDHVRITDQQVAVTVTGHGSDIQASAIVRESGVVNVSVPDAAIWWPIGYGAQALYDVQVAVGAAEWNGRVGFRTVELDTAADASGAPFLLRVNNRPVLVRGANWIPDHAFLTEMTPARYRSRISDAVEANVNLLRVWGGGIYEDEEFYRACDETGVLVWQDLLFACAAYAEEPWLAEEVEAEVREAVTVLSPHPSLVIWNGNNENLVAYAEWGWRPQLVGRTWGNGYYRELFPQLLAELDPTRPYTPGSPFSFDEYLSPNDDHNGSVHIWDVWNQKDYQAYRDWTPRFVAEFGFQGPPAWSTLTEVVHDEPLDPYGDQMLVHQKANDGNHKLADGMRGHLPEPSTIDDWHFATQLNQAHAIRFGIEYFRSLTPFNSGMIIWQLNDDWPVVSWSLVDFQGHRKPVWHAVKAAYRPVLLTVQERDTEGLHVVLVNGTNSAVRDRLLVQRMTLDGTVLASAELNVEVDASDAVSIRLPDDIAQPVDAASEVLVATGGTTAGRAVHDFAEVIDQDLSGAPFTATVEATADGATVHVTAVSYARDILLFADRVDRGARVDSGLVTLLPGERTTITVSNAPGIDTGRLLDPLVLRHAGDLSSGVVQ